MFSKKQTIHRKILISKHLELYAIDDPLLICTIMHMGVLKRTNGSKTGNYMACSSSYNHIKN
jgi:hypothetical protein